MIYSWIYDQLGWAGVAALTLALGLFFYFVLVQLSYYYYFVRHRARLMPDCQPSDHELREARLWSVATRALIFCYPLSRIR